MAKLQIPLEDELMAAAKIFALQNGTTLKEVVISALKTHIKQPEVDEPVELVHEPVRMAIEPKPDMTQNPPIYNPFEDSYVPKYPNPLEDNDYVIKKTAKVGSPVIGMAEYETDGFKWLIMDGCRPHFDKTGKPIPFRITDYNGKVLEPSEEEIAEIEATGLKVVFEK